MIVAAWLLGMAALGTWLSGQPGADLDGIAGLVPPEQRPPAGSYVRLTLRSGAAEAVWSQITDQLGPRLPGHTPLAPPPAEARAWLDAHVLYRLASADHATLARRLEPAALRTTIAGVRARLASPLFAVGDEDPRRDLLGLRALSEPAPARLGWLPDDGPSATASGDLLSADGRTLLLYLRSELPPARLHAWISVQLVARFEITEGIEVDVLPVSIHTPATAADRRLLLERLAAGLAALTLVLALGLRRVRSAIALVLAVGAGAPLALLFAGGLDPFSTPLLLVLLGAAAGLALPAVGTAASWSTLRQAVALLPLLLLPYPAWQRWALAWLLGLLTLVAVARAVAPAIARLLAARPPPPPSPSSPRPWPLPAALIASMSLLGAGAWSLGHVSGAMLVGGPADPALAREFFAPRQIAELRSEGTDELAALSAATADAELLAPLIPGAARRMVAPGAYLLAEETCAARLAGLTGLDLPGRVELLRVILTESGLRPDAFGEFLQALDLERQPTPTAALAGPLAGWFRDQLETDDSGVAAISRVELVDPVPADVVLPARLHGPAVFAHREQQARHERLGLALIVGAWLAAFLTWLADRRLSTAITAALIGVAAQAGALALAVAAGATSVPLLLPPLLIVGATAADAAARRLRPVPTDSRPALALACQVAPALVLLASDDLAWRGFGLVLGFGGVLGHALATRATPGLAALLRRREEASP